MELMNPCGVFETKAAPLAPRAVLGPDVTVGLFANDKKNADVLLDHVRRASPTRAACATSAGS